jgi:prolipoprotein diacylglyceryltransferase
LFLIFAWVVWSFFFWRYLRNLAVKEDEIFDIMFYTTILSFFTARLFFVASHIPLFSDGWLKVVAVWVQPGLSFIGGLIGAVVTSILLGMKYKVRIAYVLDAFTHALSWSFIIGSVGALLDGSVVGKITTLPWGVTYIGYLGLRHPVEMYESICMVFLLVVLWWISKKATKESWSHGILSMWFFTLFATSMFLFEFLVESDVYWGSLSANQWIYVGILGQAIGAFYVRGGGKEKLILLGRKTTAVVKQVLGGMYGKFSRRHT